ncbi:AEC family transporter [Salirhabdus sp. Marseille-P4669]|uniref:AEC family transporter n=1 Tax=Salirhabdus sp. Marseille-P4669 TaxID=2042310 RepID=UPI000C7BDF6C|nr:AEC family transporter [Salirhabdus sp. Marseille-P4669]
MASSYGNTGFLGIPLLIAAFGQEALVPAAIATFMYDVLLITFVIVSFELRKKHQTPILKRLLKTICFNPINIALLLGILVAMLKIDVPLSVQVFCETLGNAAGPTALFALGFGLVRDKGIPMEKIKISELSIILSLKLFVQPILAFLLIRFAFPLEETWAIALIILSGLPTGAMAYVFAERYKTLYEQMPKWILATTISSLLTLTILLLFLVGI